MPDRTAVLSLALGEPLYCSPWWLHQVMFPPPVNEGSLFSTPPPAFLISDLFHDGLSDRCEVASHCGFELPLPVDLRRGASAHAPLGC